VHALTLHHRPLVLCNTDQGPLQPVAINLNRAVRSRFIKLYSIIANSENIVYGTVAIVRLKSLNLDRTIERRPNLRYCSYYSKFRGPHSPQHATQGDEQDLRTGRHTTRRCSRVPSPCLAHAV
jgi:hypothetical protein